LSTDTFKRAFENNWDNRHTESSAYQYIILIGKRKERRKLHTGILRRRMEIPYTAMVER
jgi:hypothetical protein